MSSGTWAAADDVTVSVMEARSHQAGHVRSGSGRDSGCHSRALCSGTGLGPLLSSEAPQALGQDWASRRQTGARAEV